MVSGWGSWGFLARRKRGWEETVSLSTAAWKQTVDRWWLDSSPRELATGQVDIAQSCTAGSSVWTSGRTFFAERIVEHWNQLPWRCSRKVWLWHLRLWFSGQGQSKFGLDELGGIFQPKWFYGCKKINQIIWYVFFLYWGTTWNW